MRSINEVSNSVVRCDRTPAGQRHRLVAPANIDLLLMKALKIREGKTLQFRAEALNAFNHPLMPAANTSPTSASFGKIIASTQGNYPRRLQFTMKFVF